MREPVSHRRGTAAAVIGSGLLAAVLVVGHTHAAHAARIDVCGTIASNTTWSAANVYVVNDCLLHVAAGARLTLEPGTIVKFNGVRSALAVSGELQAVGTAGAPVAFTSITDDDLGADTNGDGQSTGSPGEWSAIRFVAGSTGRLSYAVVAYGGSAAYDYQGVYDQGAVESYGGAVAIEHSVLRVSGRDGLYAVATSVAVSGSQVLGNARYGLNYEGLDPTVPLTVRENAFNANGAQGGRLELKGTAGTVTIAGNTASGPHNGFRVGGTLASGTVVADNGPQMPLVVDGIFIVDTAATATLHPGTVVKFSDVRSVMSVRGTLHAEGTAAAGIAFTSIADDSRGGDTNGNGPSSGSAGQWAALRFPAGAHGTLTYATLAYGGSAAYDYEGYYDQGMLESWSSAVSLAHGALIGSGRHGLYARAASVGITDCEVRDHVQYGLYYDGIDRNVALAVNDNRFAGSGAQGGWLHVDNTPGTITVHGNVATGARNGFRVDGGLTGGSLLWDNGAKLVMVIEGLLGIGTGTTVTAAAGTIVKMAGPRAALLVGGTFVADGTGTAGVVVTSLEDDQFAGDTNGDGASVGAAGQWSALRFLAGSRGRLRHTRVAYGGSGAYDYAGWYNRAAIESYSSDVTLDYVTLLGSGNDGLYAEGASVAVTHATIAGAARYGLYYKGLDANVPLVVTDSVFSGSAGRAMRLELNGNPPAITFQRNTGSGTGFGVGFSLSGVLTRDAVWDNTGSLPLLVEGGVSVAAGATLTVLPGTVVKFVGVRDTLAIGGRLVAEGTPAAPIAFTSFADDAHGGDSNGDGASTGVAGQWAGLRFAAGARGSLAHVYVGFGGSGAYDYVGWYNRASLESYTSDLRILGSTVHASLHTGLYAQGASVSVVDSAFVDNQEYGLRYAGLDAAVALDVRGNTFDGNGQYGAGLDFANVAAAGVVRDNAGVPPKNGFRLSGRQASGALVWDNPDQVTVVDGGVIVGTAAALDLAAGTVMKFAGPRDVLHVEGQLTADGRVDAPIVFTALRDDAYGGDTDGEAGVVPAAGQWAGLRFVQGSRGVVRHARVTYGASAAYDNVGWYNVALIEAIRCAPVLEHVTVADATRFGIYTDNALLRTAFGSIARAGASVVYNATPGVPVDAKYTWWGDPSGPRHPTLNPAGRGGTVTDGVLFRPWLGQFTWLPPDWGFLHDVARLEWAAFDTDPAAVRVTVVASGETGTQTLGEDRPGTGAVDWDTTAVPDGPFTLRAVFRDGDGQIVAEAVRDVVVNNDPTVAWHTGAVDGYETWGSDRMHVVAGDVTIGPGDGVRVVAGAVVKIVPGARIMVADAGVLTATGADGRRVILTAISDDTLGGDTNVDGARSRPQPGDWGGVVVQGTGRFDTNQFTDVLYASVDHAGVLAGSETWLGSMVHRVTGDVVVPAGATLTIQAGAVVKVERYAGIGVATGARLVAAGTVAQPVMVTSLRDDSVGGDSNGDGEETAPVAGDWRWIYVDGATTTLDHVVLRYGGGTRSGSWEQTGVVRTNGSASVTVSNGEIRDAFFDGILAWGGEVTVQNTLLTGIDRAIAAHPGSPVHVINCTVDDNRIGLLVHGGTMDVANTLVTNSLESGVQYDFGTLASVRYTDVWAPADSPSVDYRNTTDLTGRDGNVSIDPRYVGRARGDFRLTYRSPAIDAADGLLAPPSDRMGAPRYDDPRSPNTGIVTAGGAYADFGAYEFVETAASDVDLVVTAVQGPSTILAGEAVTVEWTVANVGTGTVTGPWHDALVLVIDPESGPQLIPVGDVATGSGVTLAPGQSLTQRATFVVPGGAVGNYQWQVLTNVRGEVYEGQNAQNNQTLGVVPVRLEVPALTIDGSPLQGAFARPGEQRWFKLVPTAGTDVRVSLVLSGDGAVDLYVARGFMPTVEAYEGRSSEWDGARPSMSISGALDDTYYMLAVARRVAQGPRSYQIAAAAVGFEVTDVRPTRGARTGTVTLTVRGSAFPSGSTVHLAPAGGGELAAVAVRQIDATRILATFDLSGAAPGQAAVVVRGPDGATQRLGHAFEVVATGGADFWFTLTGPQNIRAGRRTEFVLQWGNRGLVDAPIHLLDVALPANAEIALGGTAAPLSERLFLLTAVRDCPVAVVPPDTVEQRIVVVRPLGFGRIVLDAGAVPIDAPALAAGAIDWAGMEAGVRPQGFEDETWDAFWAQLTSQFGTTWADFAQRLAAGAMALNRSDEELPAEEGSGGVDALPILLREIDVAVAAVGWSDTGDGTGAVTIPPPRGRLLVSMFGVEDYRKAGKPAMKNAAAAFRKLYWYLRKTSQVPVENFLARGLDRDIPGFDDDVSLAKIDKALDDLTWKAGAQDTALFYFAGHSGKPPKTWRGQYASKYVTDGIQLPSGEWLTWEKMWDRLKGSRAKQNVVILDACHSGAFIDYLKDKVPEAERKTLTVLAAAKAGTFDFAPTGDGPTTFTNALVEHLAAGRCVEEFVDRHPQLTTNGALSFAGFIPRFKQEPQVLAPAGAKTCLTKDTVGGVKHPITGKPGVGKTGPPGSKRATTETKSGGSVDPNEKVASGAAPASYVPPDTPLRYTVYFENDPALGATAPVQELLVTDALSPLLDWSTVELGGMGFGAHGITVPPGHDHYAGVVQLPDDPYPLTIEAGIDRDSGVLTWRLWSVDPVTGTMPADPFAGFLPVNDASGRGQGFVSFSVRPRADLALDTQIVNGATITFDPTYGVNPPIVTNETLNTLGNPPPCTGDCNWTGDVTNDELITMMNVALGGAEQLACWHGNPGGGAVTVDRIIAAVNNGVSRCW